MGRSESIKAKWAEPEFRAKMIAARQRNAERMAELARRRWDDPDMRARMSQRRAESDRYISKQGYVVLRYQQDHPLASRYGELLEHRAVLYAKIGPGSHPCHWCGKVREWGGSAGIHADHLDADRTNNDPENLVPSCKKCNGDRGKKVI